MKNYAVEYVIKANCQESKGTRAVRAESAKEACQMVEALVHKEMGRNAFRPKARALDFSGVTQSLINDRLNYLLLSIDDAWDNEAFYAGRDEERRIFWEARRFELGAKILHEKTEAKKAGYVVHITDNGKAFAVRA